MYLPNEFHGIFCVLFGCSKMIGEEIIWPFTALGARTEGQNGANQGFLKTFGLRPVFRFTVFYKNLGKKEYFGLHMSRLVGKPTICICENKDADQLRGNREADQRLCFRYSDSTIPLLLNSEISSFYLFFVLVQVGLCRTCSESTLLVFPRGSSYYTKHYEAVNIQNKDCFTAAKYFIRLNWNE